jgi:isoquinoline 1-oxidoreductase beta subunit
MERHDNARRSFLIKTLGAGAGAWLTLEMQPLHGIERHDAGLRLPPAALQTSAWLTLLPDGRIQVQVHKSEMGQGVLTALPMLIAEELDLPLSRVEARIAPAADAFRDERGMQSTGYSSSISSSYLPFRTLGAVARELLLAAAAAQWQVPAARLQLRDGFVSDTETGRRAAFQEFLEVARTLPVPSPTLKAATEFRLFGTRPMRLDTPSKVDGSAVFASDVRLPGMRVAVIARAPTFDGVIGDIDDSATLAVPGVIAVRALQSRVAVIAETFWAAERGRAALKINWDPGANESNDSALYERELASPLESTGEAALVRGDIDRLRATGPADHRWLRANYFAPFLAHAALEPLATTVWFHDGICELWVGTQAPSRVQDETVTISGLPRERVKVNCLQIGGSFGRRGERDYVTEAVMLARTMPGVPVKVMWSRADDLRADFYRPASSHRLAGCVTAGGELVGLAQRIAAPSIARRRAPQTLASGHDFLLTQGSDDMLYDIEHIRVDYHEVDLGVPVGFWRSVGHSYNGFVLESFIDELAALAQRDPLDFRLALLRADTRMQNALRAVAAAAGWGKQAAAGTGLGIACMKSYGTRVAIAAEVAVEGREWRATRVWCAVDCGRVVHPGLVEQQMQGGIVFGLTAAMYGEIRFENGAVQQANFNDYPLLAMSNTPQIAVEILTSDAAPTGTGEPSTPVIAPAVANALFAATGVRLRRMPLLLPEPPAEQPTRPGRASASRPPSG